MQDPAAWGYLHGETLAVTGESAYAHGTMRVELYPDPTDESGLRRLVKVDGRKVPRTLVWAYPQHGGAALYVHGSSLRERLLGSPLSQIPPELQRIRINLPSPLTHCPYVDGITYLSARSQLRFDFQFWMDDWKGDWTIADYVIRLREIVRQRGGRTVRWAGSRDEFRDIYEGFSIAIAGVRKHGTLQDAIAHFAPLIGELHEETEQLLREQANAGAVTVRFDFPEPVRGACEQYLVYFADFLRDLGVGADTALTTEAGAVLFSVKPTDSDHALGQIREALDVYLRLPASPIAEVSFDDIAAQKLLANIRHLEGQLALARAVMHAQRASIEAQATTIENQQRIIGGDVVINSMSASDREELAGGAVALTKYEGKGFEINLAHIMRRLRTAFKK